MRYANLFAKVLADILGQTFFVCFCLPSPWVPLNNWTGDNKTQQPTRHTFCTGGISMSKSSNSFVCVCVDVGRGCKNLLRPLHLGDRFFALSAPHWHSINIYLRLGGLFRERAARGRSFIRESAFSLSLSHTQTANPPAPAAMNHLKNKTWQGF